MKKKKKNKIMIGFVVFLIITIVLLVIKIDKDKSIKEEQSMLNYSEKELLKLCSNLSFEETVKCSVKQVNRFYYYNISNQETYSSEMSFDKLLKEGGTCKHYAIFYERWFKEWGFESKHISLLPNFKHGFSVVYDSESKEYCIIDQQMIVGCSR